MFSRGLLALQGPQASAVLSRLAPQVATMKFMTGAYVVIDGARCYVTRSGYTGGDGYEISTPADQTDAIARKLLSDPEVKPIGLGARDSLRLEAGLCLYGHDIDTTTTPVEADAAVERRRGTPRAGRLSRRVGHPEADRRRLDAQAGRPVARRQGDRSRRCRDRHRWQDRRHGDVGRLRADPRTRHCHVGYVERAQSANGTKVDLMVRGKPVPAEIVPMPFVKHAYYRG